MVGQGASKEIYAVIPARGGSKRVEKKNIASINGKPLVAYPIETARASRIFSRIIVNSDDEEILITARKYHAETYRRPDPLGRGNVFLIDVIKEMVDSLNFEDDTILGIMLATCPLINYRDIMNAFRLFKENGGQTPVVSVTTYETPIQLAHFISEDGCMDPFFPADYRRSTRSTDHRQAYRYNEGVIFNTVGRLTTQTNLIGDRPIPYIMPVERSISIDYPYQIDLVRLLIKSTDSGASSEG